MNCADDHCTGGFPKARPALFTLAFAFTGYRLAILVLALCSVATTASADWLFGGYMGAAGTASNTLTVSPAVGPAFELHDVSYKGEAFRSPWYYGIRVGWLPAATRGLGYEAEWTHAKAIAQIDPASSDLNAFQQSHGLNFLLGNVVYRFTPECGGRCVFGIRGGAGISTPHVESTFRGAHQEQYQYGGFAWQAGAGIEYQVWQFVYAVGDARVTRVSEKHLRGAGAEISGSFFTRHVDFGVSFRFPNR